LFRGRTHCFFRGPFCGLFYRLAGLFMYLVFCCLFGSHKSVTITFFWKNTSPLAGLRNKNEGGLDFSRIESGLPFLYDSIDFFENNGFILVVFRRIGELGVELPLCIGQLSAMKQREAVCKLLPYLAF